nr:fasciclin domain-containing protein [Methylobacterium sp. WL103]
MMRTTLTAALLASGLAFAAPAFAETAPMVGGAPMMADKTIVENASKASNLTTLVAAVKAAGLADTLSGKGPFTVFAPTNAAFAKLPAGTVDTLLKPDMKKTLTGVLTYHVVPGKLDAKDLMAKAKMGGTEANLKTVEGQVLTVKMDGDRLALIDQKGGGAFVEQADVFQSNGVVHVIDSVLMPK